MAALSASDVERTWELRPVDESTVVELAGRLGLLPTTARVLAVRGVDGIEAAQQFLHPSLDRLHSPFAFRQMEAAVERLLAALHSGERIVVHGDYDVDGVTGTVVLVTVLRALGADVAYLVPHRIRDGYGLKPTGVDRARELGAGLLIAVDCGITASAAAERAQKHGIDLIIADHHEPGDSLPRAIAVLNPCLPDSGYPEPDLAAVGVAFQLARGLLERHQRSLRATALLKLVAIGTVADMVPLVGENRAIAHYGLSTLLEAVNPGLRALLELAGVIRAPVSAGDIAFRVAPRINAAGRLGDAADAVEMFLASDPGRARHLARQLHSANDRRRRVEEEVLEAAVEQAPTPEDDVVVAAGEGWHRGVIGIVASRLVERWDRPAVVISIDGDRAYGSARSVPGFNIVGALAGVREMLEEYGGHEQAAGLRLVSSRIGLLREALTGVGGATLADARRRFAVLRCDAELALDQSVMDLALELDRLGPFGVGNPRPRLLCRNLVATSSPQRLKEQHLKLVVEGEQRPVEVVGWGMGDLAPRFADCRCFDAVATLQARRWGGRVRPQLELVDLRKVSAQT